MKEGVCDNCGSNNLTRRADDNAQTAMSRLDAYAAETAPLVAYYDAKKALHRVDAMQDIENIETQIAQIVRSA